MVADDYRVHKIQEYSQNTDILEFEEIFSRSFSSDEDAFPGMQDPFTDQLRKLCIVNHIFKRDIELYMHYG